MKRNLFLLGLVMVVFLSGCNLAPKYSRPTAPVPVDWPAGAAYGEAKISGTAGATELMWRDILMDDRLRQVVETALGNNRDLRVAVLNVERAQAMYGIQRAELFPSVNAVGSGSKGRIPADLSTTGKEMTAEQYSVSLGISSWEIDFFGRLRNLRDKTLEEYVAMDQTRRSAQIVLVSSVAGAYLTLAADREILKLVKATLEAQETSFKLIRKRYDVGLASELDLRRAQSQVETARGDVARYTQLVAQDENVLNLLVGSPVPPSLLPPDLESVSSSKEVSAGLSSEILLRRPDVLSAEHRLRAAYANIGAARAAFFPRITLTTSFGTASADLSGLFRDGSSTWSFAPQIVVPIFDARTWSAYKVTKVDREIAVAQYEKTIQTAFREVADALAVLGTVDRQLGAQQSLVEALSATYRLSNTRYMKGIDSYLSVLDAQRTLYSAQQGLILLQLSRQMNRVTIYKVLGGGA